MAFLCDGELRLLWLLSEDPEAHTRSIEELTLACCMCTEFLQSKKIKCTNNLSMS